MSKSLSERKLPLLLSTTNAEEAQKRVETRPIAGRRYMDGGVRSATNADLASGYNRILILNPLGANANFLGARIDLEVAALEREGSQVLVIAADAASATVIGLNPLDPATRQPTALAGRSQGRECRVSVSQLWSLA